MVICHSDAPRNESEYLFLLFLSCPAEVKGLTEAASDMTFLIEDCVSAGWREQSCLSHPRDYLSKWFLFDLWKEPSVVVYSVIYLCLNPCYNTPRRRHVYDNVGLKDGHHIYENVSEVRDATPDLILAVKPKVPLEEGQVKDRDQGMWFVSSAPPLLTLSSPLCVRPQYVGAEFGDDRASASETSSRLTYVDRAERNSRALSLHKSITKSKFVVYLVTALF